VGGETYILAAIYAEEAEDLGGERSSSEFHGRP
jgi:hypothetical protein